MWHQVSHSIPPCTHTHTHIYIYYTCSIHPEAHYARNVLNKQNAALYFALSFVRTHDILQRRESTAETFSVFLTLFSSHSLSYSHVLRLSVLGVPFTCLIHSRRHMIAHNSTLSRSNKNIRGARAVSHVPSSPASFSLMFFTWPRTRALRRINLAISKRSHGRNTYLLHQPFDPRQCKFTEGK